MKIFVEGYNYKREDILKAMPGKDIPSGIDYTVRKDGITFNNVGYFYSKKFNDCIFFLPKVVIPNIVNPEIAENNESINPESIINPELDVISKNKKEFLYNFSVWIYRAINVFNQKNPDNKIISWKSFSNLDSSSKVNDSTFIDIILSLIRFNNENQDFFMYIIKNIHSGYNKINWNKTISKTTPFIQNGTPIYLNPVNKKKQINFDEELLIIFFSILDYIARTFSFKTPININYELIPEHQFKAYLDGIGVIRLRQIKYKYFSDKALKLWNLCYAFFEKSSTIHSSAQDSDFMLAKSFNIIFENMIDEIIGDKDLPEELKVQGDGKIVDHIFKYKSLINQSDDVYYIGDSKYYKLGNKLGEDSIFKQYTYARNVIQYNINWFLDDKNKNYRLNYRDKVTEGYNITPNFFISAYIKDNLSYSDSELKLHNVEGENFYFQRQFGNRLFDRDTLWLSHYDVNFLFVLSLYARNNESEKSKFKETAKKLFQKEIIELLNSKYNFYILKPKNNLEDDFNNHFRLLYGKVYQPIEKLLILALQKEIAEESKQSNQIGKEDTKFLSKICNDFHIWKGYKLGNEFSINKLDEYQIETKDQPILEQLPQAAEPSTPYTKSR